MSKNLENIIIATRVDDLNINETKDEIKDLILELIGEDEDPDTSGRGFKTGYITRENKLRADLRKKVEEL